MSTRLRITLVLFAAVVACTMLWCSQRSDGQPDASQDAGLSDIGEASSTDVGVRDADAKGDDGGSQDSGADACAALIAEAGCTMPAATANCDSGWCEVPAGCFVMGSPPCEWGRGLYDEDQVQVSLTKAILVSQFDTTQAQWNAFGFDNPSGVTDGGLGDCDAGACPVGNVTWYEALSYANALSESEGLADCYTLTGCSGKMGHHMSCVGASQSGSSLYACGGYRLPTEAEWEYAARAGTTAAFYDGPISSYGTDFTTCHPEPGLDNIAWYCMNGGTTTHPVGGKLPNAFGLYDMTGNAMQWVNDTFTNFGYGKVPMTDPGAQLVPGTERVTRGGLFNVWATVCRSANRFTVPLDGASPGFGFRLVRTK